MPLYPLALIALPVAGFHTRRWWLPHREPRGLFAFLAALVRADLRQAMAGGP